jgi:protein TonB
MSYQRNLLFGLLLAVILHLGLVGSILVSKALQSEELISVIEDTFGPVALTPPPTIKERYKTEIKIDLPQPVEMGKPTPVPDALITKENSFPTQADLNEVAQANTKGPGEEVFQIPQEDPPGPYDFVSAEVLPVPVKKVTPEFPRLARLAEVTGTVHLRVLVDKEGKVGEVLILQDSGTNVGFEETAVEAVNQWLFSPAIQNGIPISIWVNLQFNFELK